LHYIAENIQDQLPVHDFIAKGMEQNWKSILRNGKSYDISLSFQNIRKKSLYEAVEVVITKFLSPNLAKGGGAYAILLDRSRTRCQKPGRNSRFFEFWDKNAEKFSIPSPEGNNAVRIMTIQI
jgi:hypothetical protein